MRMFSEIIEKLDFDILLIHSYRYGDTEFIISKEDSATIGKYKWSVAKRHHGIYAYCNQKENPPEEKMLHRLISECPKGMCVDHINRNTLDNRRENLRICTYAENNQNMTRQKSKLNIRYVGYRNRNQHYEVCVGKRFRKRFYTLIEAIKARNDYIINNEPELWKWHKDELIMDEEKYSF